MAKKSKEQEQSPKKLIQNKIITHLLQEFQQLETLVGKKEWTKRLKKSAKIITQGLEFEEATKEDIAEEKPAAAAPKKSAAKKLRLLNQPLKKYQKNGDTESRSKGNNKESRF
ncbi:hypothetical protein [Niabella hibiscisoli]|uniref:hypothetical protein n=1 Tax=Niabella hibiscisoli TaxID=1825928 RepID=UPI001F0F1B6B|nr:hypothetical protein [Niabella hibiscisoli]MCH5719673.1 hypothetical protein [Niabella hibiscisoli]